MLPLRPWISFVLLLIAGVLAVPRASQAQLQSINFCTLYQQSPQTEDVRSTLTEEWDGDANSWSSVIRTIVSYSGSDPTEVIIQERGSSGAWRDTLRARSSYDSSDRLTRCTIEQKQQDGTFANSFRTNYSYNSNGRVDVETNQVWDTTDENPDGTWVNATRSTYTYDSGNVVERVDEAWDRDGEEWTNNQRVQYSYDSSDRVTEKIEQISGGGGLWINRRRTTNSYGSDGITESVIESWDTTTQSWENVERTLYTYPSGDTREEVDQNWTGSDWVNVERRTTTLNANDLRTTVLTEEWSGSEWTNSARSETSYTTHDGTQKFERTVAETWDADAEEWMNSSRITFSYTDVIPVELAWFDGRTDTEQVVLEWQTASETGNAGFEVQHRPSTEEGWQNVAFIESKATGGSTSEPRAYRYRTESLTPGLHRFRLRQVDLDGTSTLSDPIAVELHMGASLRLSAPAPNPVADQATFSFATKNQVDARITLYNVLGQQVATLYEGTPPAGEQQTVPLNTDALPSGTYVVQLHADGQTRTQRVTVVK